MYNLNIIHKNYNLYKFPYKENINQYFYKYPYNIKKYMYFHISIIKEDKLCRYLYHYKYGKDNNNLYIHLDKDSKNQDILPNINHYAINQFCMISMNLNFRMSYILKSSFCISHCQCNIHHHIKLHIYFLIIYIHIYILYMLNYLHIFYIQIHIKHNYNLMDSILDYNFLDNYILIILKVRYTKYIY